MKAEGRQKDGGGGEGRRGGKHDFQRLKKVFEFYFEGKVLSGGEPQ